MSKRRPSGSDGRSGGAEEVRGVPDGATTNAKQNGQRCVQENVLWYSVLPSAELIFLYGKIIIS